ncbi:hypothetical protein [Winogradskya humida]|uniref:HEAT repeat protein n=1 Tax=Winogradskya humida TaxID=113566 RepID=A0ABQ3ZSX1_9ACTN|nr:hypothetical protein [Actinoplanes humidus]GIE21648.1 hypothetical protein Ahu01nite_047500 [Actinoplanes humidus]
MSSWDRAFHAYGPARGGDELLDVLQRGGEDTYLKDHPGAVWQPYTFLWTALHCGGRITPATVLGLRHLVSAVTADDFGGSDPTLRVAAVWWIRDVIRSALTGNDLDSARLIAARRNDPAVHEWLDEFLRQERSIFDWDAGDAPGQVLIAAARVDCFDFLPECFAPLSTLLAPSQPEELRAAAASATALLVAHPSLRRYHDEITAYHAEQACQGSPRYRESMVLGLGELGVTPTKWLSDAELGVRVSAALAPGLVGDETAAEVLRLAYLHPAALDGLSLHQLPSINQAVAEALGERSAEWGP